MAAAPKARDPPPKPRKDKELWKQQQEELVNNIKYARKVADVEAKGGDIRTIAAPKMNVDPTADYK